MSNALECPYCEYENDMTDALSEGLSNDNTTDWECQNPECEKEFEVHVEFEPRFSSVKIVYTDCEKCGKSTRDICEKGRIYPWPKNTKENKLCRSCFGKLYFENQ